MSADDEPLFQFSGLHEQPESKGDEKKPPEEPVPSPAVSAGAATPPPDAPPDPALNPSEPEDPALRDAPRIAGIAITAPLGEGGMGVVWRGTQSWLDREVAVKVLSAQAAGESFATRFQREAKILAGLKHPHIVGCYQAGITARGRCFLVMEFVDGPNLRQWVQQEGPLPQREVVHLCRHLAEALQHAYESNIVHRDVKPENVLLERLAKQSDDRPFPFRVKLADLGLARSMEPASDHSLTVQGVAVGTPATMAPEQYETPKDVDHRADIYGLGCVLYHALTGEDAFRGETMAEIFAKKSSAMGPDPRVVARTAHPAVVRLIRSMLAHDRSERPSDYADLIARCDRTLAALERSGGTSARRWVIAGVAAVALVAAGYFLWLPGGNAPPIGAVDPPASAREGEPYTLQAHFTDADDDALDYLWEQTSGPPVDLQDETTDVVSFTPPQAREDYELGFAVTVHDGEAGSPIRAETTVSVQAVDDPPALTAGEDQTVGEGDRVVLRGSADDPDDPEVELRWRQKTTRPLELAGEGAEVSFIAPADSTSYELVFELIAGARSAGDDAAPLAIDAVRVMVEATADPPGVEAGEDLAAREGETVTLIGDLDDRDGIVTALRWRQKLGAEQSGAEEGDAQPPVELAGNADSGSASFVAPQATAPYELEFELVAETASGGPFTDSVRVRIAAEDDPPQLTTIAPRVVGAGESVEITASASDPDTPLDRLTYSWKLDPEPPVELTGIDLTGTDSRTVSFTAPEAPEKPVLIALECEVSDGNHAVTTSAGISVLASLFAANPKLADEFRVHLGAWQHAPLRFIDCTCAGGIGTGAPVKGKVHGFSKSVETAHHPLPPRSWHIEGEFCALQDPPPDSASVRIEFPGGVAISVDLEQEDSTYVGRIRRWARASGDGTASTSDGESDIAAGWAPTGDPLASVTIAKSSDVVGAGVRPALGFTISWDGTRAEVSCGSPAERETWSPVAVEPSTWDVEGHPEHAALVVRGGRACFRDLRFAPR